MHHGGELARPVSGGGFGGRGGGGGGGGGAEETPSLEVVVDLVSEQFDGHQPLTHLKISLGAEHYRRLAASTRCMGQKIIVNNKSQL